MRFGRRLNNILNSIFPLVLVVVFSGCTDISRDDIDQLDESQSDDNQTGNDASWADNNRTSSSTASRKEDKLPGTSDGGSLSENLNDSKACSDGVLRCSNIGDAERERCEGGEWVAAEPCMDGEICDISNTDVPGTCIGATDLCRGRTGASECVGSIMHQCGEDGRSVGQVECASERHCQVGLKIGTCAKCLPGEHQCDGADLIECAPDGSLFYFDETCPTADLCNASAGACTDKTCLPDTWNCSGDMLQRCNQDQTAFEDFELCDPGTCNIAEGHCDICNPGAYCSGNTLFTCDETGLEETVKECLDDTPYCIEEGECVECVEDENCSGTERCKEYYCFENKCEAEVLDEGASCGTPSSPKVCDKEGKCVACLDNEDCGLGQVCNASGDSCDQVAATCPNLVCPGGGTCKKGVCAIPCYSEATCIDVNGWSSRCYYNEADGYDWLTPTSICLVECGPNRTCPSGFECQTKTDNGESYGVTNANEKVDVCLLKAGW